MSWQSPLVQDRRVSPQQPPNSAWFTAHNTTGTSTWHRAIKTTSMAIASGWVTSLHCSGTLVSDCSPLKGMPLEFLDVSKTRVHDLSPLTGAPLNELWIFDSLVSDLAPLKGMSLRILSGSSYHLSDFSVIKDMPLRYLGLVFNSQQHTDLLRSIKTLDTVNDKPIAEFWKEVEATKP
jgi:hypothetical protein